MCCVRLLLDQDIDLILARGEEKTRAMDDRIKVPDASALAGPSLTLVSVSETRQ